MKKAFTLIELMIVVAIIAIIAAIAIPNLLESRMQANESNAIAALRSFASAQATYKKANYSAAAGDGNKKYANTLAKLSAKKLIPGAFASATTNADGYQGYYFLVDTNAGTNWKYDFGLFGNPCVYAKSGVNMYFIDGTGEVKAKDMAGDANAEDDSGNVTSAWYNP